MKKTILVLGLVTASSALVAQDYGRPPAPPPTIPQVDQRAAKASKAAKDAPGQRKVNISKPAQKAVIDLQNTVNANDFANIPAKLAAAKAAAKTDEDRYYIGILELKGGIAAKDNAMIASAIEGMLTTNQTPQNELAGQYINLGKAYNNLKQFDKAIPALDRAIQLSPANTEPMILLAEIQAAQGQNAPPGFQRGGSSARYWLD